MFTRSYFSKIGEIDENSFCRKMKTLSAEVGNVQYLLGSYIYLFVFSTTLCSYD